MSKKNISDYMPEKDDSTTLVQAKVKTSLFDEFKPVLKGQKQTFKAFVEACMSKFIDENKGRKVG